MNFSSVLKCAAVVCLTAVVFGAFAAHALKNVIDIQSQQNWETATRYQFYHGLALLLVAALLLKNNVKWLRFSASFFLAGIIMFSGSLYVLSLRSLIEINVMWLGPITPLGGLCFILGWCCLFKAANEIQSVKS